MTNQDWQLDSDIIFTAISSGGFDDFQQAQQAVVLFYVPDMRISRGGISHALKRLENFYSDLANTRQKP